MKVFLMVLLCLFFKAISAQIPCSDPIGNVVLTSGQNFPIDVDGVLGNDFLFSFFSSGESFEFDIEPLAGGFLQSCGDLGTPFACAYFPDDIISEGEPFMSGLHILVGVADFGPGGLLDIGNYFQGNTLYLVFRLNGRKGWIEIFINSVDGSGVDFDIGKYGIEPPPGGTIGIEVGNCSAVMPIELGTYSVVQQSMGMMVNWEILSSRSVDYFAIQKSEDGFYFFDQKVFTELFHELPAQYSWLDQNPFIGANYYRIATTDLDGSVQYSDIRQASWQEVAIALFPNPIAQGSKMNINFSAERNLTIFNTRGQEVASSPEPVELDTGSLLPGLYNACLTDVEDGRKLQCSKLIILSQK